MKNVTNQSQDTCALIKGSKRASLILAPFEIRPHRKFEKSKTKYKPPKVRTDQRDRQRSGDGDC